MQDCIPPQKRGEVSHNYSSYQPLPRHRLTSSQSWGTKAVVVEVHHGGPCLKQDEGRTGEK